MIRLSRKAWNNVIIFAMLIMILLFNTTTNILNTERQDNHAQSLIPEGAVLMTLETNGHKVERIGQGWRIDSDDDIHIGKMPLVVERWHSAVMQPISGPENLGDQAIVIAWLAGQQNGRVYRLFSAGPDTVVEVNEGYFIIHNLTVEQLTI